MSVILKADPFPRVFSGVSVVQLHLVSNSAKRGSKQPYSTSLVLSVFLHFSQTASVIASLPQSSSRSAMQSIVKLDILHSLLQIFGGYSKAGVALVVLGVGVFPPDARLAAFIEGFFLDVGVASTGDPGLVWVAIFFDPAAVVSSLRPLPVSPGTD